MSSNFLSNKFSIADSSLKGEDHSQRRRQTDLSKLNIFLGLLDGQIKAGGHFIENNSGIEIKL